MVKSLKDMLDELSDPVAKAAQGMLSPEMANWLGTQAAPVGAPVNVPGLNNIQVRQAPTVPTTMPTSMEPQQLDILRMLSTYVPAPPISSAPVTPVSGAIPGATPPLPTAARGNPGQAFAPANTGTPYRTSGKSDLINPYNPRTPESIAWAKANVGKVSAGGANVQVHTAIAPLVEGFLNELSAGGYKIDPSTTGGYNDRWQKHGGKEIPGKKSNHQSALSFDINWGKNAQGQKGTDLPSNVRQLAAKYGLTWGMDFSNPDPMHFEFKGSKADAQALAKKLGIGIAPNATKAEIVSKLQTNSNVFPSNSFNPAEFVPAAREHVVSLSPALRELIRRESAGDVNAKNPKSSAFGIGQLLNDKYKLRDQYSAKVGVKNPNTTDFKEQLAMMEAYIKDRYGTPEKALEFHKKNGWY